MESDVTIIGAGVIGLAVAYFLSKEDRSITVIEKNSSFGQEASSRNSEVIHAGIYYPRESYKAKTCIRGRELLYEFCNKHKITCKKLGKLIVASGKEGASRLRKVYRNALDCGLKDLRFLNSSEIKSMEPDLKAEEGIFSPSTGIFDTHQFMYVFYALSKEMGADFAFSVEATGIKKKNTFYEVTVKEPQGGNFSFRTKVIVNAGGLWSDRIAGFVGIDVDRYFYRIHYAKGQYFRIRNPKKFSIAHLVYPPPADTDLGIHITPDLGGGLRLGPDTKYIPDIDYTLHEEEKGVFLDSVGEFLPSLEEDDIIPDTVGIRPKLQGPGEGFRDFVICDEIQKGFPRFINLIGVESPGLTSSLAIGEIVRNMVAAAEV